MKTYTVHVCWKVEMGDAIEVVATDATVAARGAVQMMEASEGDAKVLPNSEGPPFVWKITDADGKDCPIPAELAEAGVSTDLLSIRRQVKTLTRITSRHAHIMGKWLRAFGYADVTDGEVEQKANDLLAGGKPTDVVATFIAGWLHDAGY